MLKSSQTVKCSILLTSFLLFSLSIELHWFFCYFLGGINDEQRCWTSLLSGWTKFGCHWDALATVLLMFPCWDNRHHSRFLKTAWLLLVLRRTQVVCEVHFWGTTCYTSMVVIGRCNFLLSLHFVACGSSTQRSQDMFAVMKVISQHVIVRETTDWYVFMVFGTLLSESTVRYR